MKQLALLFFLLVGVIVAAYWSSQPGNLESILNQSQQLTSPLPDKKEQETVTVGQSLFEIQIAKTEKMRATGLSKYSSLKKGEGMLFVFDEQNVRPSFWMRGMKFPIDIIWIDDGKVAQITENIPPWEENELSPPSYYVPNQPVDYVLEIAAGSAQEKGIKIGDSVTLP